MIKYLLLACCFVALSTPRYEPNRPRNNEKPYSQDRQERKDVLKEKKF